MEHRDHVNLLREGVAQPSGGIDPATRPTWADFGSGTGAFTLALADLLRTGSIYSVDRDGRALAVQSAALAARFPDVSLHLVESDFTRPLDLPPLDGIVIANALHFVAPERKLATVRLLRSYLGPGGRLVLVEYNTDEGNRWVPYPLSYLSWHALASRAGFGHTAQLASVPSRFLREFYSAVSW